MKHRDLDMLLILDKAHWNENITWAKKKKKPKKFHAQLDAACEKAQRDLSALSALVLPKPTLIVEPGV